MSDLVKKLKLKEYVTLMREVLFERGPKEFVEAVEMVDKGERRLELLQKHASVL